jgi:hypothetical protein
MSTFKITKIPVDGGNIFLQNTGAHLSDCNTEDRGVRINSRRVRERESRWRCDTSLWWGEREQHFVRRFYLLGYSAV